MANFDDTATEYEEFERDLALRRQKESPKFPRLTPKGRCHNCNEPLLSGILFCDKDCCSDYEALESAKKRNGR